MKTIKPFIACISLLSMLTSSFSYSQDIGDNNCGSLLLVSSWFNNKVKIYDGCSGDYIRDMAHVNGPQAILELPDGDVLVVSEGSNQLIRYDRETLSNGTAVIRHDGNSFVNKPVGAILGDDDDLYVVSYEENSVLKVSTQTWQTTDTILAANNGLITGADAGIALENNILYIPGYDSDNIVTVNVATKQSKTLVSAGSGGLDAARGVLIVNDELYVTSERSNKILKFNKLSGAFIDTFDSQFRPASIVQDGQSHFLTTTRDAVYRLAKDGSSKENIVASATGGLDGATFVLRLSKNNFAIDSDQDGLSDDDEISLYNTDPNNSDSDQDSLLDGVEVLELGSNPNNSDSDADEMPDSFENQYQLAILENDSNEDKDSDGLSNLLEYQTGTDPTNADTDGDGLNDSVDSLPLTPSSTPSLSGAPDVRIEQGAEFTFTPTLSYPGDLNTIVFSIENKPDWAEFSTQNGQLSGQPENDDVGTVTGITISASNGFTSGSLDAFTLEVINVNDPPVVIQDVKLGGGAVLTNVAISTNLNAFIQDPDTEDTLTFSVIDLPSGLTLTPQGVVSGSIASSGQFTIVFTATDDSGASVTASSTLNVSAPEPNNNANNESSGGGAINIGVLLLLICSVCLRKRTLTTS